jgi:hypothetical protein
MHSCRDIVGCIEQLAAAAAVISGNIIWFAAHHTCGILNAATAAAVAAEVHNVPHYDELQSSCCYVSLLPTPQLPISPTSLLPSRSLSVGTQLLLLLLLLLRQVT